MSWDEIGKSVEDDLTKLLAAVGAIVLLGVAYFATREPQVSVGVHKLTLSPVNAETLSTITEACRVADEVPASRADLSALIDQAREGEGSLDRFRLALLNLQLAVVRWSAMGTSRPEDHPGAARTWDAI